MPHRDPLLAALARCAQLRARIEELSPDVHETFSKPVTLAAAVSEAERLASLIADLERDSNTAPADDDIPPIVDDAVGGDDDGRTTPVTELHRRRAAKTAVFGIVLAAMVSAFLVGFPYRARKAAAAADASRRNEIIIAGSVVEYGGNIGVRAGDRCTIAVSDSGRRSDLHPLERRCGPSARQRKARARPMIHGDNAHGTHRK